MNRPKANSTLGANLPGVVAGHVVFDAEGVVQVPSHLSNAEAACLPCAGVTAWHATGTSANLKPSDTVLMQGTGGVSLFVLCCDRVGLAAGVAHALRLEPFGQVIGDGRRVR